MNFRKLSAVLFACAAHGCMGMPENDVQSAVQELVNGSVLSNTDAARTGVVRIHGGSSPCTGTLVRGDWVLTTYGCWLNGGGNYTIGAETRAMHPTLSPNPQILTNAASYLDDIVLVRLDAEFAIQHPGNPDAPFFRAVAGLPPSAYVGGLTFCTGTGTGQVSNPANLCSSATETGVARSGYFNVFAAASPPSWSQFFEVHPQSNMQPLGGDLGSSCMVGDINNGQLIGVMSSSTCGVRSLYAGADAALSDKIAVDIGPAYSSKALYGYSGGALTEFWHIGQQSAVGTWQQGQVGSGWSFRHVIRAANTVYGIDSSGYMRWYRHDGEFGVASVWAGRSGMVVGSGWNFTNVVARDNGEIFALDSSGNLKWYQHNAYPIGDLTYTPLATGWGGAAVPAWSSGSGTTMGNLTTLLGGSPTHLISAGAALDSLLAAMPNGNIYRISFGSNHLITAVNLVGNIPSIDDIVMVSDTASNRRFVYYTNGTGGLFQREFFNPSSFGGATLVGSGFPVGYRFVNSGKTN